MTQPRYPTTRIRFSIEPYTGEVSAPVDTGCDIALVAPARIAAELPPSAGRVRAVTASGERLRAPAYRGRIELVEQNGAFEAWVICLGDEYLLGLPALNRFRITLDHGQRLIIEP